MSGGSDPTEPHVIGAIVKNLRETILVSICNYQGHVYLDLRIHAVTEDGVRPTKSGVTVRPNAVPLLRAMIESVEVELRKRGLIDESGATP